MAERLITDERGVSLLRRRHPVSCWLKRLSFRSLYLSFFSALDLSLTRRYIIFSKPPNITYICLVTTQIQL